MSFLANLEWRHATKAFDTNQKLNAATLEKLTHAIHMAPSSFGLQPFRVEVIEDQALREKLRPHAWNQAQITSASALFAFIGDVHVDQRIDAYLEGVSAGNEDQRAALSGYGDVMRGFTKAMSPEQLRAWTTKQTYIALGFAMAACAELKIDSCPMEGFDATAFDRVLDLKSGEHTAVLLAVGTRDPKTSPRPKFRFPAREMFRRR